MPQAPSALLFIATGCQHCPAVLQSLAELLKAGELARLEIINIQQDPAAAEEYHVRSVPWARIGPFELLGLKTKSELQQWIDRIGDPAAMGGYFAELMTSGEMAKIKPLIEKNPETFNALLELMASPETTLSVRIGVGAVMEEFSGHALLKQNITRLAELTHHQDARLRNDACYYLGLSQDASAADYLKPLLEDSDPEVRESAEEALEELTGF